MRAVEIGDFQELAVGRVGAGIADGGKPDPEIVADVLESQTRCRFHGVHAVAVIGVPIGKVLFLSGRPGGGDIHLGIAAVGIAGAAHRRGGRGAGVIVIIGGLLGAVVAGSELGGQVFGGGAAESAGQGRSEVGVRIKGTVCINRQFISSIRVVIHPVVIMVAVAEFVIVVVHGVRQVFPVHAAGVVQDEHDVRLDRGVAGRGHRRIGNVCRRGTGGCAKAGRGEQQGYLKGALGSGFHGRLLVGLARNG